MGEKIQKVLGIIIFILVFSLMGILLGYFVGDYINEDSFLDIIIMGLFFFFLIIISFYVLIIVHELGHLIFGLATGYSFVSFRIGFLTLIKEEKGFSIKKFSIPGTGGQCLMIPPEEENGDFPYILYNLGGVIMNMIVAIIFLFLAIYINSLSSPIKIVFIILSIESLILGLLNGIPHKIGGMPNDGYNLLSIIKDNKLKRSFYIQLKVNGLVSKGKRYRDLDEDIFYLHEESDISNPLNTNICLMKYNHFLDILDFYRAKNVLDKLAPYLNQIIPLYVYEIYCERVFLELIGDLNKEFIDKLYDEALEKYIKESKYMMSKIRLLMAYELFYKKDEKKALQYYEELKKSYNSYPLKGEADMELMLGRLIIEKKI